jgi:hypothetical protein
LSNLQRRQSAKSADNNNLNQRIHTRREESKMAGKFEIYKDKAGSSLLLRLPPMLLKDGQGIT